VRREDDHVGDRGRARALFRDLSIAQVIEAPLGKLKRAIDSGTCRQGVVDLEGAVARGPIFIHDDYTNGVFAIDCSGFFEWLHNDKGAIKKKRNYKPVK